jgi:hypothetical protein
MEHAKAKHNSRHRPAGSNERRRINACPTIRSASM